MSSRVQETRSWAALSVVVLILLALYGTPSLAATSSSNSTVVSANVVEAIAVTQWPGSSVVLTGSAIPDTPVLSDSLSFVVKSNTLWGIQVSADEPSGKLREYDVASAVYVMNGRIVKTPIQWALTSGGPWTNLSATPTAIYTGQAKTGELGATVSFVLRLLAGFNDEKLPLGRDYRMVLTYTVAVGY